MTQSATTGSASVTDASDRLDLRLGVLGIGLVCVLLMLLRSPPDAAPPPRIDPARCEAWMADALPGIGEKRRQPATDALRGGSAYPFTAAQRQRLAAWFAPLPPHLVPVVASQP